MRKRRSSQKSEREDGAPELQLHLKERIGFLLLVNIVPILGMLSIAYQWSQGKVYFSLSERGLNYLFTAITLIILLGISSWIIYPIGKWIPEWSSWHYQRRSKWLWFLPNMLGQFAGVILQSIAWCAMTLSLFAIVYGIYFYLAD